MVANADTAHRLDDALTNLIPWHGPVAPRAHLHTTPPPSICLEPGGFS